MNRSRLLLTAAVCAALVSLSAVASAQQVSAQAPERQGFTIKLSLGAGGASLNNNNGGEGKTYGGLGGLNLALGGFVHPDWAVLFKISGVNYGSFSDSLSTGLSVMAGPAVQYWLHDRVHVELAAGLGLNIASVEVRAGGLTATATQEEAGFGAVLGLGVSLLSLKNHALGLYADFGPVVTANTTAVTFHGGVAWQYH